MLDTAGITYWLRAVCVYTAVQMHFILLAAHCMTTNSDATLCLSLLLELKVPKNNLT